MIFLPDEFDISLILVQCYGLKSLPVVSDAENQAEASGVTLKCSKQLELVGLSLEEFWAVSHELWQAYYRDLLGNARAYQGLSHFAKMAPLHLVYGAINDYMYAFIGPRQIS